MGYTFSSILQEKYEIKYKGKHENFGLIVHTKKKILGTYTFYKSDKKHKLM